MIVFGHLKNFFLRQISHSSSKKSPNKTLATEMYKILNGLSPDIMQDIFEIKNNYYNSRNVPAFSSRNIKTVRLDYRPFLTWPQKFGTLWLKR